MLKALVLLKNWFAWVQSKHESYLLKDNIFVSSFQQRLYNNNYYNNYNNIKIITVIILKLLYNNNYYNHIIIRCIKTFSLRELHDKVCCDSVSSVCPEARDLIGADASSMPVVSGSAEGSPVWPHGSGTGLARQAALSPDIRRRSPQQSG